jgi:hypothetical protein
VNLFRKWKMQRLLGYLEIQKAGFHAFRHFNASLLDSLRVPLKTIQERLLHALSGSKKCCSLGNRGIKEAEEGISRPSRLRQHSSLHREYFAFGRVSRSFRCSTQTCQLTL